MKLVLVEIHRIGTLKLLQNVAGPFSKNWKLNRSLEWKWSHPQKKIFSFLNSRLKSQPGLETLTDENGHVLTSDKGNAKAFARAFKNTFQSN